MMLGPSGCAYEERTDASRLEKKRKGGAVWSFHADEKRAAFGVGLVRREVIATWRRQETLRHTLPHEAHYRTSHVSGDYE